MKKFRLSLVIVIFFLGLVAIPALAYVMSSSNYRIESDVINFSGGENNSANYILESSFGEAGTGYISSASYFGSIGYLQSESSSLPNFCDNDGICEPGNGETTSTCPNDCVVSTCNNNGVCEPSNGETSSNCADCQIITPTTTPTTTETFLISNIVVRAVSTSSAEIIWETNRSAICGLSWGLTTDYLSGSSAGLDYLINHSRPITGLQSSSTYHYKIFCQDQNGSTTQSLDDTFTTLSSFDELPPSNVIGLRNIPGDRKIFLFWINPSDNDFSGVIIRRSTDFYPTINSGVEVYRGMGNPSSNQEVFFEDLNLTNDIWYYYSVFAYDTSNNFASGAITAGKPFTNNETSTTTSTPPESSSTTPITSTSSEEFSTTTIETTSTTTFPELTSTTSLISEQDLFFKDFDFNQNGSWLKVKENQVNANLSQQLIISLRQEKIIPGTARMIIYLGTKNGIEAYLFAYNSDSQIYSVSIAAPEKDTSYNVNIVLFDQQQRKIKEIYGWINFKSQKKLSDQASSAVVDSVKTFYQTIKPVSEFAKSTAGKSLAGTVAGVSTINLAVATPWWNWHFLQLIFSQPWLLFFSRRRKGWGTVYNSITKKPIDLALVRLYDVKTNRLIKSRVTDISGRYMFLVDEGEYYLQVEKPGFNFPSKLLNQAKEDDNYVDLYYGEKIFVSNGEKGVIIANIPLDPPEINLTNQQIIKKHFKFRILRSLSYLGPFFAFIYLVISPSLLSFAYVILHLVLLFFFYRLAEWKKPKNWGRVYEKESKKPLSKTITKIFSPEYNRMLEYYVTDNRGRYGFLTGSNKYYITAEKEGYNPIKTEIIDLSSQKEAKAVFQDLVLSKISENLSFFDSNQLKLNEDNPPNTEISQKSTINNTNSNNLDKSTNLSEQSEEKNYKNQSNTNNKLPPKEDLFG